MTAAMTRSQIAAATAALLLAAPAAAVAKKGPDAPKGKGPKTVSFVLKGTYQGQSTVLVAKGNGPAKKAGLVGQTVTLDLAAARIVVADVNGDGARTVDDVQVGDKVVVKVKAPRGTTAADTLAARQLVDQTHKAGSDDDAPEAPEVEQD
jgi:hypothetical protein